MAAISFRRTNSGHDVQLLFRQRKSAAMRCHQISPTFRFINDDASDTSVSRRYISGRHLKFAMAPSTTSSSEYCVYWHDMVAMVRDQTENVILITTGAAKPIFYNISLALNVFLHRGQRNRSVRGLFLYTSKTICSLMPG
jgi:hypothetical protein